MNIADSTYMLMYNLLINVLQPAFILIIINWRETLLTIMVFSFMYTGYKMMYSATADMNHFIKMMLATIIMTSFISHPTDIFTGLKFVFLDAWLGAGQWTLQAISGALGINPESVQIEPNDEGTAFGVMWDVTTAVADQLWEEGGIGSIGVFFLGIIMYLVAVLLLLLQIVIMATALTLVMVAMLSAPVFSWMFLFPTTKKMFESWLALGLGSGIALFLLMVLTGVIYAFFAAAFALTFGINIEALEPGNVEPDVFENVRSIASLVLFACVGIKMVPKVENWASSIAGVSVAGMGQIMSQIGSGLSQPIENKVNQLDSKAGETVGNVGSSINQKGGQMLTDAAMNLGKGVAKATGLSAGYNALRDSGLVQRLSKTEEETKEKPVITEDSNRPEIRFEHDEESQHEKTRDNNSTQEIESTQVRENTQQSDGNQNTVEEVVRKDQVDTGKFETNPPPLQSTKQPDQIGVQPTETTRKENIVQTNVEDQRSSGPIEETNTSRSKIIEQERIQSEQVRSAASPNSEPREHGKLTPSNQISSGTVTSNENGSNGRDEKPSTAKGQRDEVFTRGNKSPKDESSKTHSHAPKTRDIKRKDDNFEDKK